MAPRSRTAATATVAVLLLALGACQKSNDNGAAGGAPKPVVNNTVAPSPAEIASTRAATATDVGPTARSPIVTRDAFARAAAIGDLYEIQAGKLALERSKTPPSGPSRNG